MKFKVINFPLVFNSKIYPVGSIVNLPPADHNLPNIIPVVSPQSSEVSVSTRPSLGGNTLASSDSSFVPLVPSVSDNDKTDFDNSELKNSISDNSAVKKRGRPKKNNLE